jgi:hypothetical protein
MRRPLIIVTGLLVAAAGVFAALFALLADTTPLTVDVERWRVGYGDEWGA